MQTEDKTWKSYVQMREMLLKCMLTKHGARMQTADCRQAAKAGPCELRTEIRALVKAETVLTS
jgi:hypothetical protein